MSGGARGLAGMRFDGALRARRVVGAVGVGGFGRCGFGAWDGGWVVGSAGTG